MSTREKSYEDYGFSRKEAKELIKQCRNLGAKESSLLKECAMKANNVVGYSVYYSLIHGLSYEKLSKVRFPEYSKVDFYGYRRRTIALFREAIAGLRNG